MMSRTLANVPVSSFNEATDDVVRGESIQVPSVTGMSVEQAKQVLRQAQLEPVESGDRVYASYAPAGTVAYSYPGDGASVYPGQRVVIYVSAGPPPAEPPPPTSEPQNTLGPDDCKNSNRPDCRKRP
jgi:beta-lactam-binding protein with PASTA domain